MAQRCTSPVVKDRHPAAVELPAGIVDDQSWPGAVEPKTGWMQGLPLGPDATMRTLPHRQPPVKRSGPPPSSRFATEVERLHAGPEPLRR